MDAYLFCDCVMIKNQLTKSKMIPIGKMFKVKILAYLSVVKANLNMQRGIVSGRVALLP